MRYSYAPYLTMLQCTRFRIFESNAQLRVTQEDIYGNIPTTNNLLVCEMLIWERK